MADTELTGQDWRVLSWVSLHDGMSLFIDQKTGKSKGGAGCIASNKLLFQEAGCDYTSGCRSLSKLVDRGHLVREKLGKATVYRVVWPDPDNLQACNTSSAPKGGKAASDERAIACKPNLQQAENALKTDGHYSPPSGELDSVETGIKNFIQDAHSAGAKRAAIRKVSLKEILPANFSKLAAKAQLTVWDDRFDRIDRDPGQIVSSEREIISKHIHDLAMDNFEDNAICNHAQRLLEELLPY